MVFQVDFTIKFPTTIPPQHVPSSVSCRNLSEVILKRANETEPQESQQPLRKRARLLTHVTPEPVVSLPSFNVLMASLSEPASHPSDESAVTPDPIIFDDEDQIMEEGSVQTSTPSVQTEKPGDKDSETSERTLLNYWLDEGYGSWWLPQQKVEEATGLAKSTISKKWKKLTIGIPGWTKKGMPWWHTHISAYNELSSARNPLLHQFVHKASEVGVTPQSIKDEIDQTIMKEFEKLKNS